MKNQYSILKAFVSIFLIGTIGISMAQEKLSYPLKPLYQEFTSSTCGPCAGANEILDPIMAANPGTHSLIKYQMNWPGVGDPYYTEEGGVRRDYYEVTGVPDLYINDEQVWPGDVTQDLYDSYLGLSTNMGINILTAEIGDDLVISISAEIEVSEEIAAGLTAHVVVVEKATVGNIASNGEEIFYNVMMKMLPDAYGTELPALSPGATETLSFSYDMDETNMEQPSDLAVIVFVQDDTDKSILQSETADVEGEFEIFDVFFTVEDSYGTPIEDAEIFLQGNGFAFTDEEGNASVYGVSPGIFDFNVEKPGFFEYQGNLEVVNEDVFITVTMEAPDFYWFEMFDTGIPEDWNLYFSGSDFVYWADDGFAVFFKQSGNDDMIMLATPAIDINPAHTLSFKLQSSIPSTPAYFGTISDPNDPSTFDIIDTIYPEVDWNTYEYDVNQMSGNIHFAWGLNSTSFAWYSLDDIFISIALGEDKIQTEYSNIQIYPNPTKDNLYIESKSEITQIQLTNISGQIVLDNNMNSSYYELSTSALNSGVYLVKIYSQAGITTKKLIVK